MIGPRQGVPTWDEIWMATAKLIGERSKDPSTQVGSCIVDDENIPIGLGYNGFPKNISNYALPWDRKGAPLLTKYMYMSHAEANAIDNSDCSRERMKRSKIYCTLHPCNNCAIRIIQNGIKEVIYLSDKYHNSDEYVAARKMFGLAEVITRKLDINKVITIKLKNG